LALLFGFAAARLKIPPLVGYLLAGVAVGPFTPGFVADARLAPQLAEIGVILLMFGVGMHFSVRDLWAVRAIALPGALVQVAITTALGAGVTALWGWPLGAGLVFGLALSVASTVVLLRAMEVRQSLDSPEGPHRGRLADRGGPADGAGAGAAARVRGAAARPPDRRRPRTRRARPVGGDARRHARQARGVRGAHVRGGARGSSRGC
jgi:hypothetical protein